MPDDPVVHCGLKQSVTLPHAVMGPTLYYPPCLFPFLQEQQPTPPQAGDVQVRGSGRAALLLVGLSPPPPRPRELMHKLTGHQQE